MSRAREDLFGSVAFKKRVFRSHVVDAGCEAIKFAHEKCGWNSGWLVNQYTLTEARAGILCPRCNGTEEVGLTPHQSGVDPTLAA